MYTVIVIVTCFLIFKETIYHILLRHVVPTAGHTCTNQSSPPIPCTTSLPETKVPAEYMYRYGTHLFTTNKSSFFQCLELWYFKIAASIRFLDCTN
jgi:hypothetical protein